MTTPDIAEAVQQYYRLKHKYDDNFSKTKKENITAEMSNSKIRDILKKLKQNQKCIICKKKGGTIFTNNNRILTAKCGNTEESCNLDIQIKLGKYMSLNQALNLTHERIEESKASIIDLKLDLLFGLRTEEEIASTFEEDRKQYKTNLKHANSLAEIIKSIDEIIIDEPGGQETRRLSIKQYLRIKYIELKNLVTEFKNLIKNYMEEENTNMKLDILRQAMEIYVEQIFPLMTQIRENKYEVTMMEEEGNLFVMKQIKVLPEKLDFAYEPGEIISNKK